MHPAKKTATIRRIGGQSDARANATKPTSSICLDVIDGGDSIVRGGEKREEREELSIRKEGIYTTNIHALPLNY
jgi:hypothetical protein